jgi:hypothetical protein
MRNFRVLISIALGVAGMAAAGVAAADEGPPGTRANTKVLSSVVGVAGSPAASATRRVNGTAGQSTPIGYSTSAHRALYAGFWKAALLVPSGIDPILVEGFRNGLFTNRPNPVQGSTWITYSLAREGSVELKIFDATGRAIRTLVDDRVPPGVHQVVWDGRDDAGTPVASGVYFYRVASGDFVSSRKLMLIR